MMVKITRVINTKKTRKSGQRRGMEICNSQIFKPITTALRQGTMRGVACRIEQVERKVSINTVGMAGVKLMKTIET